MNLEREYQKYKGLRDEMEQKVNWFANIRMILFIIMIISFILKYYYYPVLFQFVFVISLVLFIVMVIYHDKYFKIYNYYEKYVEIVHTYLDRKNGKWKNFLDKGEDFLGENEVIFKDLDLLGDCSLFQYLSVCKTLGGREHLFKRLSNLEMDNQELKQSQDTILELAKNVSFDIRFQIALQYYEGKKIHLEQNFSYLEKKMGIRKSDLIVGGMASFLSISFFLLGCFHVLSFSYFYGMFLFNLMMTSLYAFIFREEFQCLTQVISSYGRLREVFICVIKEKFHSELMKKFGKRMEDGLGQISKLNQMDGMNSLKNNLVSNLLFNGFGCLNLFLLYYFSKFLNQNLVSLKRGVEDVAEVEALVSLATIGIVKKNCCMPRLSDKVELKFSSIQHPLLDENVCVGNDFDGSAGVNLITGSNMGGKTSFLRMIGINLILMNAGGFVCAKEFCSSYFKIFTSMRVLDNIERGISTFYGELLRIQGMVDYVDKGNMLVLIDEIFKGTNYQDRMYGAREVIKRLNTKKTITFITTHDFELCGEPRVRNYHVQEEYDGDKIVFDYKIRKGKCTSTNARYLMKKLGIVE